MESETHNGLGLGAPPCSPDYKARCIALGKRLAQMPGEAGWHLLYRPLVLLEGMSVKEWLDAMKPIEKAEEAVAATEHILSNITITDPHPNKD